MVKAGLTWDEKEDRMEDVSEVSESWTLEAM